MEFIDMLSNNLAVIIGVIVAVLILIVIVTGYVKASPDTAYIISTAKGFNWKSRSENSFFGKEGRIEFTVNSY